MMPLALKPPSVDQVKSPAALAAATSMTRIPELPSTSTVSPWQTAAVSSSMPIPRLNWRTA